MKALAITPGDPSSLGVREIKEPGGEDGVLLESCRVGVCGTDLEIASGAYGEAPPHAEFLVLGHECVARVLDPGGARLREGEWVVPMVRHPDPVPCYSCARGEWDMCRNGLYTEHGIKGIHGFARERFALPENRLVPAGELGPRAVLVEPASILAKAWEQVEAVGGRTHWEPRAVLVVGAGPIGLMGALLAIQRGLEVHVLDKVDRGRKPEAVSRLGVNYLSGDVAELPERYDVVLECTGVPEVVLKCVDRLLPGGVLCLTGVSPTGRQVGIDPGLLDRELVLQNEVVVGSVNANRRHYEAAVEALGRADPEWLECLITRTVPLERFSEAFSRGEDDIKTVIELAGA
jgi:threonine dehydrogenase-like Zn-dependent dehydrogenase